MQNYLQKPELNEKVKKLLCVMLLGVLSAIVILAIFNRYDSEKRENTYPSSLFATLPRSTSGNAYFDGENDIEMNNSVEENAKTAANDAKIVPKCRSVKVLFKNGKIQEMELEEYITGCVFGEMPLSFETQALMAQCVAARTFTVRQASGKSKHKNADVCTDSACCQNYVSLESKEISLDNLEKLKGVVNVTKGIIMTYEGEPIEAVYHASSGEYTLDSEDVWGGRVEYLRSVPSPEGEAELKSVVYGHRVGMSQHGANLLAKQGMGFADILKYYYSGISLNFLSGGV